MVLITHPGRQHSHQLALALHEVGLLAGYWTGVPTHSNYVARPLRLIADRFNKNEMLSLPEDRVRHCLVSTLTHKTTARILPEPFAVKWAHRGNAWFDRWAAKRIPRQKLRAVICYENSALETFNAAKKRGVITILDAASLHHTWQDRFYRYIETEDAHLSITQRKDQEVALADHVLTASEIARMSYLAAGVQPERVTSVPLGCDLACFKNVTRKPEPQDRFTFVFAGYASPRKGIDVLLSASGELHKQGVCHRLLLAGGVSPSFAWHGYSHVEHKGRMSQRELADVFRESDCLVLPSRHESFGMVVVEAMATGLPVIVSDRVGAKEALEEGKNGWIVPANDVKTLTDRMRWCINNPEALKAAGTRAAIAAQKYSWGAYHTRVVQLIRDILGQ